MTQDIKTIGLIGGGGGGSLKNYHEYIYPMETKQTGGTPSSKKNMTS
ncbi:MAG: hypothetical protein AB3N14_10245 [Flavobacteriaceae bacterium]